MWYPIRWLDRSAETAIKFTEPGDYHNPYNTLQKAVDATPSIVAKDHLIEHYNLGLDLKF